MARKRAKKGQLAKRSRGRSKIERDLLNRTKGKVVPLPSSSASSPPPHSSSSSSGSSSSDLEAARPNRKRAREQRSASSPLSVSDSHSDLARAVSQVSVQVGMIMFVPHLWC